jgi:hypothetical protein
MSVRFNSIKILALTIMSVTSLAGCGLVGIRQGEDQVALTISTEPPGAKLYENGMAKGISPMTVYYKMNDSFKAGKDVRVNPFTAIWISGAEATTGDIKLNISNGDSQGILIRRPSNYPNAQLDISHAMNLKAEERAQGRALSQGVSNMGQRLLQNNGNR